MIELPDTILIVDDEPAVLRVCERQLGSRGDFDVQTAATSAEALQAFKEAHPDLVLMDIDLGKGGMGGIACVAEMRARGFKGVICMFTGDSSCDKLLEAFVAGADAYYVKNPCCDFISEISLLLDLRQEQESISSAEFSPLRDGIILRSLGLWQPQVEFVAEYHSHGYGTAKDTAAKMGITEQALAARLFRIRKKLGYQKTSQVMDLMTRVLLYSTRRIMGGFPKERPPEERRI